MNQRALAVEENDAWNALSAAERREYTYKLGYYWTKRDATRSIFEVRHRHALFLARSEALWAAVEGGLVLHAAVQMLALASKTKQPVEDVLLAYVARGIRRSAPGGGYFYVRGSVDLGSPAVATAPPVDGVPETDWKVLRTLVEGLGNKALSGYDGRNNTTAVDRFMTDVRAAVSDLRRRLLQQGSQTIKRQQVVSALTFLGESVPRPGGSIDIESVRRNIKARRFEQHPDRVGVSYDADSYLALNEVLDILESYNTLIGGTND